MKFIFFRSTFNISGLHNDISKRERYTHTYCQNVVVWLLDVHLQADG
jgi:hypothetical protein